MTGTDLRDLKSDPVTGELVIEGGDLVTASGVDAVRQDVEDAVNLVRGEWFVDASAGIPYFSDVLVKSPSLAAIGSAFRSAILAREGVNSITSFAMTLDRRRRRLSIVFSVDTVFGPIGPVSASPEVSVDMSFDSAEFEIPLYS
jgi:hypothetical protein